MLEGGGGGEARHYGDLEKLTAGLYTPYSVLDVSHFNHLPVLEPVLAFNTLKMLRRSRHEERR